MAAKRDFRAIKVGMVTASVTAAGLVYWGIAANANTGQDIEVSEVLPPLQHESIQPLPSAPKPTGQDVTTVVVVPWPTAMQTPTVVAAIASKRQTVETARPQQRVVVIPRPRARTRAS